MVDEMVIDHWAEIMDAAEKYRQNEVANKINAEETENPEETENFETDDLVIYIEEEIQTETETVADEDEDYLNNSNIETPVNNSIPKEDMSKQGLVDYSISSDEGSDEDSMTEKAVNLEDTTIENVPLHSTPIENWASALDNV